MNQLTTVWLAALLLAPLAALHAADTPTQQPIQLKSPASGSRIRLRFRHVGGGLLARNGEPLKSFAIAGADRKFVWADARIEGDSIVVSSDAIKQPVAVRYAWADNPECNLTNAAGLPASPFRTDDWPGITVDKHTVGLFMKE